MEKKDICSYTYEELQEEVENLQEKKFPGETDLPVAACEAGGQF